MVLRSEDLEDVDVSALKLVVCRETLAVRSELEVFDALWRWSGRECKRQRAELNPANRRAVLEGAQFLVRYLTLSPGELARASGLLEREEADALTAMVSGAEEGFEMPDHLAEMQSVMRTPRCKVRGGGDKNGGGPNGMKKRLSRAGSALRLTPAKRRQSLAVATKLAMAEEAAEYDRRMTALATAERDRRKVDELKERTRRKFNIVEEFFVCLACIFD